MPVHRPQIALSVPEQNVVRGTTPLERWYPGGFRTGTSWNNLAQGIDQLMFVALPWVPHLPLRLDRIAFNVVLGGTTGAVARCGIYESVSQRDPRPGRLVVDGGEQPTTGTGIKSSVIDVRLLPRRQYWLAYHAGVAACTVRGFTTTGGALPAMGFAADVSTGPGLGLVSLTTYGALPANAGAVTVTTTNVPGVFVRAAS